MSIKQNFKKHHSTSTAASRTCKGNIPKCFSLKTCTVIWIYFCTYFARDLVGSYTNPLILGVQ